MQLRGPVFAVGWLKLSDLHGFQNLSGFIGLCTSGSLRSIRVGLVSVAFPSLAPLSNLMLTNTNPWETVR